MGLQRQLAARRRDDPESAGAGRIAEAGFGWKAATPTFSLASGTYYTTRSVTIATATVGATIRYTTDGSDPTSGSTLYTTAVPVNASTTIKARAFASGLSDSNIGAAAYTLKVAAPTFSPWGGTYSTAQNVSMSSSLQGVGIRYTADGSTPTESSTLYTVPVGVSTSTTLKAIGVKSGWTTSDVQTQVYTMNFGTLAAPTMSPAAGPYVDSVYVTLSAASGATIRYTTNGSDPTTSSTIYTVSVGLAQTTTLKAKAWRQDYTTSATTTGAYTIKVATPGVSLATGTYTAGTAVMLTAATVGSTIRYTLNGGDPTENDATLASGGTLVVGNYILKVRAFKTGCDPSDVVTATYAVTGQLTAGGVAAAYQGSIALLPDGVVYTWGNNMTLGDGSTADRAGSPSPVPTLTGVISIAAGYDHALALGSDGRVWSWGSNGYGQLGDGTPTTRRIPVQVPGLSAIVAITAGNAYSAALKSDGTLYTWGYNGYGQLGTGDQSPRSTPTQVLSGVAGMAAGAYHMLARKADGTASSWGYNARGELGNNSTAQRTSPGPVNVLTGVVRVAVGGMHSLAQTSTGQVYTWGSNTQGQLGDGTFSDRWVPTLLTLTNLAAMSGGDQHSLAALAGGSVSTWGNNGYSQLGGSGTTGGQRNAPAAISGPSRLRRRWLDLELGDKHERPAGRRDERQQQRPPAHSGRDGMARGNTTPQSRSGSLLRQRKQSP